MGTITVVNHVTLDGVIQAPAAPDEDRRGGFDRGGWAAANADAVMGKAMAARVPDGESALLMGRRTYEDLASVWPNASADGAEHRAHQRRAQSTSHRRRCAIRWSGRARRPAGRRRRGGRRAQGSCI